VKVAPLAPIETYKTTGKLLDFEVESTGNVKCLCAGENNSMVLNVFGEKTDRKTLFTMDCEVTAASTSSILEKKAGAPFYVSSRYIEKMTFRPGEETIVPHYGQDTMKGDFYGFIGKFSGGKEVKCIVDNRMGWKGTVHLQLIHRVDWQAENGDSVPAILAVHIGEEKVENGRCILVVLVDVLDETNLELFKGVEFRFEKLDRFGEFVGGADSVQCSKFATFEEAHYFVVASKMKVADVVEKAEGTTANVGGRRDGCYNS